MEAELEGFQRICSRIDFARDESKDRFYFTFGGRSTKGFLGKMGEAFVDGLFVEVRGCEVVVEELMSFGWPA